MKRSVTKGSIFLLLVVSLSGCFLKSVHPLINKENAILLEGLDGTYEDDDQRWVFASDKNPEQVANLIRQYPGENISFEPGEEDTLGMNVYLVLFKNKQMPDSKPTLFTGMVGEINGDHFLNLRILDLELGESSAFVESHTFNVNTFSKIKLNTGELVLEPFASSWIGDQIQNNRVRIKHEIVYSEFDDSSEILITASTKELRSFVEKYGKEKEAYEDPITLKRIKDEAN